MLVIEGFCQVLGEIESLSAIIANRSPTTDIIDDSTGAVVTKDFPKTAPDQVLVQATLESGAVASFHMRGGTSIGGFRWLIYGDQGEIEVSGLFMLVHINLPVPWKVRVSDASGAVVEEMDISDGEGQPSVNRLYEAFKDGRRHDFADFGHAVKRHRVIQAIYDSFDKKRTVQL